MVHNVMIVDDTLKNIQVLGTILRQQGYQVNAAQNGLQALEMVKEVMPELILLDVMMPELDGYETCTRLKANDDTRDIPVIFLTAKVEPEAILKGFEVGAVDYVTKPFNAPELLQRVKTHLALRSAQSQLVMQANMVSLGRLVAGIAHDVNNPIGALRGVVDVTSRCVQAIRDMIAAGVTDLAGEARFAKMLDLIDTNTKVADEASARVQKVIDSLRSFSRLDEAEVQEADIHEGLDSTLDLLQHRIGDRVTVVREYGGDVPRIRCYAQQLNQVFINLLNNGLEAIDGEGEVRIRTWVENSHVCIAISDSGCGIAASDLRRIFDPGYTTKGMGVGGGLGLSISYTTMEKHKGAIEVDSEVGVGSTFTIRLPLQRQSAGAREHGQEKGP